MYHLRKDNVPIGHDREYRELVIDIISQGDSLDTLPRREYEHKISADNAASDLRGLFPTAKITVEKGPDPSVPASEATH